MFSNLKKKLIAGALVLTACLGTSTIASAQGYYRTFTIVNHSSLTIRRVFVSPSGYQYWGSDRLGTYVLNPNYQFTVNLEPGFYDVKLVDQDGDSCVVGNVDFRNNDTTELTNVNLLACELLH